MGNRNRAKGRHRYDHVEVGERWLLKYVRQLRAPTIVSEAVAYGRTSGATADQRAALDRQNEATIDDLAFMGVRVIEIAEDFGCSGSNLERPGLREAARLAREADVPLVSRDLSRILRHSLEKELFPTEEQFIDLAKIIEGVDLRTLISPRTPYTETERLAARAGRRRSSKHQGRHAKEFAPQTGWCIKDTREHERIAERLILEGKRPIDLIRAVDCRRSTAYDTWNRVSARMSDSSARQL